MNHFMNNALEWVRRKDNNQEIMTIKEKTEKIKAINDMIVELKRNPTIASKQTIQRLQQQIDNVTKDESK